MAEHRRWQARRAPKWAVLPITVALAAMCLSSRWWTVERTALDNGHWSNVGMGRGLLWYSASRTMRAESQEPEWTFRTISPGELPWLPSWRAAAGPLQRRLVKVPLWLPPLFLATLTGLLWWTDRPRQRLDHCPCGYALAGLAADLRALSVEPRRLHHARTSHPDCHNPLFPVRKCASGNSAGLCPRIRIHNSGVATSVRSLGPGAGNTNVERMIGRVVSSAHAGCTCVQGELATHQQDCTPARRDPAIRAKGKPQA